VGHRRGARLTQANTGIPRFVASPRRALEVGVAGLAAFTVAAFVIPATPLAADTEWSEWMLDIQNSLLTNIALVFNSLGRGLGRGLTIAAIAILILVVLRSWLALLAFAIAEAATPVISSIAKLLVDRPRPPDPLVHPSGSSFPSGHAAYAGVTCVALVLLFSRPGVRRRLWWALAALGILGMAWSRTYLQAHWLSDVVAGSVLGASVALIVFAQAENLARRAARRARPMPDGLQPVRVRRGTSGGPALQLVR
jgi:membrane-associated phospholipid phosphatase